MHKIAKALGNQYFSTIGYRKNVSKMKENVRAAASFVSNVITMEFTQEHMKELGLSQVAEDFVYLLSIPDDLIIINTSHWRFNVGGVAV